MKGFEFKAYEDGYPELEKLTAKEYAAVFGFSIRKMSRYMLRTIVREDEIRSRRPREIPWQEEDVCAVARQTRTMRVYFMSNEGLMVWSGNLNDLEGKNWGDSTLIAFPDGRCMLVDVGMNGFGAFLVGNLRKMGIRHIDFLVLTHPHDDHCYSLTDEVNVFNSFTIGQVYYSGAINCAWSDRFMVEDKCRAYNVPLSALACGDSFDIGEVHVDVLSPLPSVQGQVVGGNDGVNAVSVVMRLKYRNRAVLMTGDTNYLQEQRFVTDYPHLLKADILKIQHHGASNSNTEAFVKAVSPKVCFCMAWKDLEPHIYKRYKDMGAAVYMDMFDGYLRCVTDGENLSWETSRPRLKQVEEYYRLACEGLEY